MRGEGAVNAALGLRMRRLPLDLATRSAGIA